jgi:type III restriction enzyme
MSDAFFERPILNSPYDYPARHWELDESGQPTNRIIEQRRTVEFITPIPAPKKRRKQKGQQEIVFAEAQDVSTDAQRYETLSIINDVRRRVDAWRKLPEDQWKVTPVTARLLNYWRHHRFTDIRPFFCQVEAIETAIWLTEVAPKAGKEAQKIRDHLERANEDANPGLDRLALKLATGAGKTTVMAMIIAWQTLNAIRQAGSRRFTTGFLIVTPGITIRDRLRVLKPNDPDSYYQSRELIPNDLISDLGRAKIVITNYHAFNGVRHSSSPREGDRSCRAGARRSRARESEGQMLQRVMPELMGMKNILVLNDEAHHCYREKPVGTDEEGELKGDDKKEARRTARPPALDLRSRSGGSQARPQPRHRPLRHAVLPARIGLRRGHLFPWTMCDFSLMDAIECGIVKLPRVPVADNIPGGEMPKFRELWKHIGQEDAEKGRGPRASRSIRSVSPPSSRPRSMRSTATTRRPLSSGSRPASVFRPVSSSSATTPPSRSWSTTTSRGSSVSMSMGSRPSSRAASSSSATSTSMDSRSRGRTRCSSTASSSSPAMRSTRVSAPPQLTRSTDSAERSSSAPATRAAAAISDEDLLREVMNTVGKKDRLGESIRCVVSVSMLTEGWDANTVTHVLGVRAFGTQLLCEQVIGRALRRQSYDLNDENLFNVEYADVLGIPFDFTAKPVVAPPQKPRETIHVKAVRPERDHLEIQFPRVEGYRVELPSEGLTAEFNDDSTLVLTPDLVGPSITRNQGIIGEGIDLSLVHTQKLRSSTLLFHLSSRLLFTKWRDTGEDPKLHLFGQLKRITRQWLKDHLECKGSTYPAQLMYQELADMACERITAGITRKLVGESPVKAVLDPYNPTGSTIHVNFTTSKEDRWETDARRCHINWVILDSDWEAEFCRVAESHPRVRAYVKNHNLGFEVPYQYGSESRRYLPDFIVLVDDGHGDDDLLHLVVEIKGYRREDAKEKKATMETYWVPGINNKRSLGRWAFAEFCDVYEMEAEFGAKVEAKFNEMIDPLVNSPAEEAAS